MNTMHTEINPSIGSYYNKRSSNGHVLSKEQAKKSKKVILSTMTAVMVAGAYIVTNAPTVNADSLGSFIQTGTRPTSSSPQLKTIKKLRNFGLYNEDWDGYGGRSPSPEAIEDAVHVLWLLPSNIQSPQATLSGDGEIGLLWRDRDVYIDIGFYGDGHYSYYAKDAQGREHLGDNLPTDSFAQEVLPILIQT